MNVKTCAPPHAAESWKNINFKAAENCVKKLKMRIAKALQEQRYNKVKSLQHLLIHSFYAKALAVKTVVANSNRKKRKTAGVDKILWTTEEDKWNAILSLKHRGYNTLPLRRVYIPKSGGKSRPLSIPTMKDRAMQTLYKFALEPIAETTADPHSYGFRPKRCTQDAITQCVEVLSKPITPKWILNCDIKGCFDNISHEWVMENIPLSKSILRKLLKCGHIENNRLVIDEKGISQGASLSPVICNMVLDGLEKVLKDQFRNRAENGKLHLPNVHLIRYADDFIITGRSQKLLEQKVLPVVATFLAERGLQLSTDKTNTVHIDDGFDFLGWHVSKCDGEVMILSIAVSVNRAKAVLSHTATSVSSS